MFISMNYIIFVRTPMIKILDPPLPERLKAEGRPSPRLGAQHQDQRGMIGSVRGATMQVVEGVRFKPRHRGEDSVDALQSRPSTLIAPREAASVEVQLLNAERVNGAPES